MRSRYMSFFTLGAVLLTFIGVAAAQTPLQVLYQAAKAEGEVIIWTPLDTEEMRMLNEGFSKDFPGIKVTHFELRETDYVPRVVAEARQGIAGPSPLHSSLDQPAQVLSPTFLGGGKDHNLPALP